MIEGRGNQIYLCFLILFALLVLFLLFERNGIALLLAIIIMGLFIYLRQKYLVAQLMCDKPLHILSTAFFN